jgi:hypothetical protein
MICAGVASNTGLDDKDKWLRWLPHIGLAH